MKSYQLKRITAAAVILPLLALQMLGAGAGAAAPAQDFDAAAAYKAKCAMCHTATASKFFDPAKADEELAQAVLKGRKGEKPPFMPAFETKGVDDAQARAFVAHMKTLRQ